MPTGQIVIDNKYCLLASIGQGGMGAVYRVRHLLLDKEMALKTFKGASLSSRAWQRFQVEVQAVARLSHSHIVQVYDFGLDQHNRPYYTMELLNGQSLGERLGSEGRLPVGAALTIFRSVAAALLHAHSFNIVHRDIKPGNIFLARQSNGKITAKVLDFGLAKLISTESMSESASVSASESALQSVLRDPLSTEAGPPQSSGEQSTTDSRLACGSPLYMSPEQACGLPIDVRSDIYSFGCTLFESLTGEPPFVGGSAFATLQMHQTDKPPRLSDINPSNEYSPQLEALVAKLLAKNKEERYQTFNAVLTDLAIIEQGTKNRLAGMAANLKALESSTENSALPGFAPGAVKNSGNDLHSLSLSRRQVFALSAITGVIFIAALMFLSVLSKPVQLRQTVVKVVSDRCENETLTPVVWQRAKEPYYASADVFGRRLFHFPEAQRIGYLGINQMSKVPAQGQIVVPPGKFITFECGGEVVAQPQLLSGFRPDDIACLSCCDRDADLEPLLTSAVNNLSGLHGLNLSGCTIESKLIPLINRFPALGDLCLSDSSLAGADLARLKRLPYLHRLVFSQNRDASAVIKVLAGSPYIQDLSLDTCTLTDDDLRNIAKCPNLTTLSIDDVPLDNNRLSILSHAPQLKQLHVTCSGLGPESIDTLAKFKKLSWLRITTIGWSTAERERLHRSMPARCLVVDRKPAPNLKKLLGY